MPIHKVSGGYKWGTHGHVYPNRAGAERQAAAAHANGWAGDAADICGAGVIFKTPQGKILFLKRTKASDYPGSWCIPGGTMEPGEKPEQTAAREAFEETGMKPSALQFVDRSPSTDGTDFFTYRCSADDEFEPDLDREHSAYVWADLKNPPQPLHPGLKKTLSKFAMDKAMTVNNGRAIAFDRASVRSYDVDGKLHVKLTPISKANICPYRGDEIPGYEDLGLDPKKIYQLYRHPDELEKSAASANNLPLLNEHIPVSVNEPAQKHVVGSTGTDAVFKAPYLMNSLVVWEANAIKGIEDGEQKELSCAYRYVPDMTPGTVDGVHYDGVMRDIVFNHLALVPEGRAGNDVVVGDQKEQKIMPKVTLSRKAALAKGALVAYLTPLLAQDMKLNVTPALAGVTTSNWAEKKSKIAKSIAKATKNKRHFAHDASISALMQLLDGLDGEENEPDGDVGVDSDQAETSEIEIIPEKGKGNLVNSEKDETPKPITPKAAEDGEEDEEDGGEMDEDSLLNQLRALVAKLGGEEGQAEDNDEGDIPPGEAAPPKVGGGQANTVKEKPQMIDKQAMDKALAAHGRKVEQATIAKLNAIVEAKELVRPHVGELKGAFDSASDVLKFALDAANVDLTDVPPEAYPAMVKMLKAPTSETKSSTVVAMDSKSSKDFEAMFPGVSRMRVIR